MKRVERPSFRNGERGAALITAALTLLLISVVAVTFLTTITGERAMSSNVHVARGSLYAADAGVRAAQQVLANIADSTLDSLANLYTGTGAVITNPQVFFPSGAMVASSSNPVYSTSTVVTFSDSTIRDTGQVFNYRYTITSTGSKGAVGTRKVQSQGILRVSAGRESFADYLMFTDTHLMPDGSKIWFTSSGHFDGRVHTNGEFRFAYRPTFEDRITSVDGEAWFYNQGNPVELDDDHNGTIDVPDHNGFERGADHIPLPTNTYSQQNAALGYPPNDLSSHSNSDIRTKLGVTPVNGSPPPNGIYIPNSGGDVTSFGIYVQGNLNSCLMSVDSLGRQVYTMVQGAQTRIITVDRTANMTYVYDGSTTAPYTGTPRGVMYTNGDIQNLGGPDRAGDGSLVPAIADENELLITATGDVVIQNDIVYNDFNEGDSVLGIYAADGSVRIGSGAPNDAYLDAFVMATGEYGALQVDGYNSGGPRGTFHLRGGMVSSYYGAFYTFNSDGTLRTGFARDFHYDRRGKRPPYYPTTNQYAPNDPTARTVVWKEM